jgi:acyl transferase domain-containing protein/acyl carrier protein
MNYQEIAIIGVACRFPGADNATAFWENLTAGRESIRSFTQEELESAGISRELLGDPNYVKASPVLECMDAFDAPFFEHSPREARIMDPQHRLLLETAWHVCEDAGCNPLTYAGRIGAFTGSGGCVSSYLVAEISRHPELRGTTGSLEHLGNDKDFLATRLAYKLNLRGPAVTVQTACSTSMVAVHLACRSLQAGDCDMAIAGASVVRVPHISGYLHVKGDILSPDGHCRAFDARAEGTVFGSGVGCVLLKPLSRAVEDGDRIYAVIRATAINNDGAEKISYTASSVPGQVTAITDALRVSGIAASNIGYVECHGTGTAVGDPLELDSLLRSFRTTTDRRQFCSVGSVKTNIGHLEQAAGMASLIKTAFAIYHGQIPASLNFESPNPRFNFERSPFYVNTSLSRWPCGEGPRIAGINSLGLGGTNAFTLLQEAPSTRASGTSRTRRNYLLPVSAKSKSSLAANIDRQREYCLGLAPEMAGEFCDQLLTTRAHHPFRVAAVVQDGRLTEAFDSLRTQAAIAGALRNRKRPVVFLYSGQGSQTPGMARDLYERFPVFRDAVDTAASALARHVDTDLRAILFDDTDNEERIHRTLYTQPVLFILEVGLTALWRSWGLAPDYVLGHSIGEYSAAWAAGVYNLEDAAELVATRARLMDALPAGGVMATIFSDARTVQEYLEPGGAVIAAENSSRNTVVSGLEHAVERLCAACAVAGIGHQRLNVSHAFHSPLMSPAAASLACAATKVRASVPNIPLISNVTADEMTAAPTGEYWRDHLLGTVRFRQSVEALADLPQACFIEIGPGSALLSFGRQMLPDAGHLWLSSLDKRRDDCAAVTESLRQLYLAGIPLDWQAVEGVRTKRSLVGVPGYAFDRSRFWLGDGDNQQCSPQPDVRRHDPAHPLLGKHSHSDYDPALFETMLSLQRFPWLNDHRIFKLPVWPVAGGLCALIDAGRSWFGKAAVEVRSLIYQKALLLAEEGDTMVRIQLSPAGAGIVEARLTSATTGNTDSEWETHMIAQIARSPTLVAAATPTYADDRLESFAVAKYYESLDHIGLNYGPAFRNIRDIRFGEDEVWTRVALMASMDAVSPVHPALVDACLHIFPALEPGRPGIFSPEQYSADPFLPVSIERFSVHTTGTNAVRARTSLRQSDDTHMVIDIDAYDDGGQLAFELRGLLLKRMGREALRPSLSGEIRNSLYQLRWDLREIPRAQPGDLKGVVWAIVPGDEGINGALDGLLKEAGADVVVLPRVQIPGANGDPLAEARSAYTEYLLDVCRLAGAKPVRVIDLRALGAPDLEKLDHTSTRAAEQDHVGGLLALVQSLTDVRAQTGTHIRLWIPTNRAQTVGKEEAVNPLAGMLWGLGRVIPLEHPQIWGGLIDFADGSDEKSARAILEAAGSGTAEDQLAYRSAKWWVARYSRSNPVLPEETSKQIRNDCAYVVTGGFGAIGGEVARWLAARNAGEVILFSRSARSADCEPIVSELRALGAERVSIVSGDVTVDEDVRRLFSSETAFPIRGVFHCAGLLEDGVLRQMNWEKFTRVTAPKLIGGWLLHHHSRHLVLDHFVVFSSILSILGSAGQVNYSTANAFLDALVAKRRALGLAAQAFNWGPWAETGLAAHAGKKGEAIWRTRGTTFMSASMAMQIFDYAVIRNIDHVAVMSTDWSVFLRQFATVPPLYEHLQRESKTSRGKASQPAIRETLDSAPEDGRPAILLAYLATSVAETLGLSEPPDLTATLKELGLDSLMSITLVNQIELDLRVTVPQLLLMEDPTMLELADALMAKLDPKHEQ